MPHIDSVKLFTCAWYKTTRNLSVLSACLRVAVRYLRSTYYIDTLFAFFFLSHYNTVFAQCMYALLTLPNRTFVFLSTIYAVKSVVSIQNLIKSRLPLFRSRTCVRQTLMSRLCSKKCQKANYADVKIHITLMDVCGCVCPSPCTYFWE